VVALGAMAMSSLAGPAMASTIPRAPASCADVLVLGARGSGQPQSGSARDGGTGLGPQVASVTERLQGDLSGRTVAVQALRYPARQAELLALDPDAYFGGLERGVANAKKVLSRQVTTCPRQRFILAGYSQGAMVMHRVLHDLGRTSDSSGSKALKRIDAAILLADGDRSPSRRVTSIGTAGPGRGISYVSPADSRVRIGAMPVRLTNRVLSVCEEGDVICDYRSLLQTNSAGIDGTTVHVSSYTGSPNVITAADAAAALVR
jgi:hypothetical protein